MVDDKIKKNIESLRGVGQVRFVGDRQRQIQVWLDGEKLYSYNLNVEQVRAALAAQNVEIPGGRIDQGARELSLRTMGRVDRPARFQRIIVATVADRRFASATSVTWSTAMRNRARWRDSTASLPSSSRFASRPAPTRSM